MPDFCKKSPCNNCPYRKDAPLKLWHASEYVKLLKSEHDTFGTVYGCHKNDGHTCVGWLMKQDENRMPSIALRMKLLSHKVDVSYFDSLHCKSPLYGSVKEMIQANYPEIIQPL